MKTHMKHAAALLACALCATCAAEHLKLKYAATVIVLDDAGNKTGTRTLKPGTEISITENAVVSHDTANADAKSPAGKPSGISPAQFIAERITTPTKFVAVGSLDAKPICFAKHLNEKTYWCASLGVYGKTRKSHELMDAYALKSSAAGQKLFKLLKDGEQHKLLITIKSFPNHHPSHPEEVELLDIKELSDSDPLITALMSTDY